MTPHVMLLRGINLGAKNKVPMPTLRGMVEKAGGTAVRTYIQSGNIVFEATPEDATGIATAISDRLRTDLDLTVPIVLLTGTELRTIAAANPFLAAGEPASACHLMLLSAEPTTARAARLDPERSPGDRAALVGRAIYLHLPNGMARTRWTNDYVDRTLGVVSTARNWRTVTKLLDMCEEPD